MSRERTENLRAYSKIFEWTAFFVSLSVLFLLSFLTILALNATDLRRRFYPIAFASVRGQIVRAEVKEQTGKYSSAYCGSVRYNYVVRGAKHRSGRIGYGGGNYCADTYQNAAQLIRHYQVATPVTVYYDPDNPGFALLRPDEVIGNQVFWHLSFFLSASIACAAIARFQWKKLRKFGAYIEQKYGLPGF